MNRQGTMTPCFSTQGCRCQPGYSGRDCDMFDEDTCAGEFGSDCGYGGVCVNNNTLLYADYEEPPYWVPGR